jgi:hypothetical protein
MKKEQVSLEEAKQVLEQAKKKNEEAALEEIKAVLEKHSVVLKVQNRLEGDRIINEILVVSQ